MRICFATDFHGRENLYEETAELVATTKPTLLIFGGDMLPDGEMSDPAPVQIAFVRSWLAEWLRTLRDECPFCEVATIFGNHDWLCSTRILQDFHEEGLITVLRPDQAVTFDGWPILGYSFSPPSPFFAKDFERLDFADTEPPLAGGGRWDILAKKVVEAPTPTYFKNQPSIDEDLSKIDVPEGRWIFVSHSPPHDSNLDRLITGQPVGSRAVRKFIEDAQPDISLHGHLHDSPYVSGRAYEQIGRTVAINPGAGSSTLAAVVFDPADVEGTLEMHGVRFKKESS